MVEVGYMIKSHNNNKYIPGKIYKKGIFGNFRYYPYLINFRKAKGGSIFFNKDKNKYFKV